MCKALAEPVLHCFRRFRTVGTCWVGAVVDPARVARQLGAMSAAELCQQNMVSPTETWRPFDADFRPAWMFAGRGVGRLSATSVVHESQSRMVDCCRLCSVLDLLPLFVECRVRQQRLLLCPPLHCPECRNVPGSRRQLIFLLPVVDPSIRHELRDVCRKWHATGRRSLRRSRSR